LALRALDRISKTSLITIAAAGASASFDVLTVLAERIMFYDVGLLVVLVDGV